MLVGVRKPVLAAAEVDAEEEAEEEEEAVPEPNDDGSDLDTVDRSFLEADKIFWLSFLMNFIAKFRELIGTRMEKISVEKTEKREIMRGGG
jgi:hypothetical protein